MGKSKRKRIKPKRYGPTGVTSIRETEIEEELELEADPSVQSVIDKLLSPRIEDKEYAAYVIANICEQPEALSALLEKNIVKIAGPFLTSSRASLRHAIAGALRNLSVYGGHEVTEAMVDNDLMTPVVALIKQYDCDFPPPSDGAKKNDMVKEIFIQAVYLLWNMCESSSISLKVFNKQNLMPILLRHLNIEVDGIEVATVVAQCLHVVSENNTEVIQKISTSEILQLLQAFISLKDKDPSVCLLRIVSAGIYLNTYLGKISSCPSSIVTLIMNVLADTLNLKITENFADFLGELNDIERENKEMHIKVEAQDVKNSKTEDGLENMKNMLTAKKLALEILTNICCSDDESGEWNGDDSSDTSDEILDIDENGTSYDIEYPVNVSCEVQEAILKFEISRKVLDHIVAPPEDFCNSLKKHPQGKNILKRFHSMRCTALLCLHNVVEVLDLEHMGGAEKVYQLWFDLVQLAFKQIDIADTELLEAATCSVRAVLQKLGSRNVTTNFSQISSSDLQVFTNLGHHSKDARIKVNIVRILGTLGCILGNEITDASKPLIKNIGSFLLEVAGKDSELWVNAEALDAIFDVFAEDHVDCIGKEISLVEKLIQVSCMYRGKIKQQRKQNHEHLAVILTAKTNLGRFLKYKHEQNKKN